MNDQSEDNIHDIRIAIRRMEALNRILPKKVRSRKELRDYVKGAKDLFRINTQIRDLDIISSKLERRDKDQFGQIIKAIRSKRKAQVVGGQRLALKLKNIPPPKLKDGWIVESKLRKRFQKVLLDLVRRINLNIPIALEDDKKINEIHELRKDFKKLRYSIELTTEKRDSFESIKSLKRIQDELGLIHDSDMFLDYLRGTEAPLDIAEIIREEILQRKERYRRFVQVFRNEKIDVNKLIS